MSKRNNKIKTVKTVSTATKKKVTPTVSKTKGKTAASNMMNETMLFEKQNYILMGVGLAVVALGFLLMMGGAMTDPNVWDESVIYSFRRITLAPFVVLLGLGIEIYAIFKK